MNAVVTEAAGWTLLHFLWQGAVIGGLFGLFLALFRTRPQVRYLAGCIALLAMAATVGATFVSHYRPLADEAKARAVAAAQPPVVKHTVLVFNQCRPCHLVTDTIAGDDSSAGAVSLLERGMSYRPGYAFTDGCLTAASPPPADPAVPAAELPTETASPVFSGMIGFWLIGVVLLSLRFTVSCGVAGRLRRCGTGPVEASVEASLRRMAGQIGVTGPVQALMSGAVMVPTVVGWLRPVILLPAASLVGLSRAQLAAVLAHELAHIRRHDYLVNLLQHVMETVLFFHPAVWWVSKKIREEREHCCDDIAAAASGSALDYARALAALEELRGDQFALGMAADGGSLLARIRRLSGADSSRRRPLLLVSALLLVAGIAISFAVLPGKGSAQGEQNEHPAKSVKILPLPSEQAEKGLRHLLDKEPETDIPYEDFVRLAESLDDAALLAMIEEVGLAGGEGYAAWTRSALFTEWGRRDFEAALAYFKKHLSRFGAAQPVLYSLFAGSRPKDPEEALKYLRSLHDDDRFRLSNAGRYTIAHLGADWVRTAYERAFAEFAAIDPEGAFKDLPGREREGGDPLNHNQLGSTNYSYQSMVSGFFSGLRDAETIERFADRFAGVGVAGSESVAIPITVAWMNHDLEAALAWALPQQESRFGESVLIGGVRGSAVSQWARENPERALEAVRENAFADLKTHSNPEGELLRGNPHLALALTEVFAAGPRDDEGRTRAWFALHSAMHELGRMDDGDRFPEVGRRNQPPDYQARYESMRAAVQHESILPEHRAGLQEQLDSVFYNVAIPVPQSASTN